MAKKITLTFEDTADGVLVKCDPPYEQLVSGQETSQAAAYAMKALISVRHHAKKNAKHGHSIVRPR